ncbi:hypothetical protein [Turicibacter sp.]|uniref:hypothetical protein n=1 Tax=Turicibacter sp. TaxID=2049042 RepID=UPI001B7C979A|nr:hypothetical protein [Turicibacter sp.]MBP3904475.1 hypothetical protein [Turicibacter sp.]MBP3908033.1 hypothetical protein [Turicibacter sp.]
MPVLLKNINLEGVGAFLLSLKDYFNNYDEELFLYASSHEGYLFLKADIKHQSLYDSEICAISEILSKDEEINDEKIIECLDILAQYAYEYLPNYLDVSTTRRDVKIIEKALEMLHSFELESLYANDCLKFLLNVQEVWKDGLSDSENLYLARRHKDNKLVARAYYEDDDVHESLVNLKDFIPLFDSIGDDKVGSFICTANRALKYPLGKAV